MNIPRSCPVCQLSNTKFYCAECINNKHKRYKSLQCTHTIIPLKPKTEVPASKQRTPSTRNTRSIGIKNSHWPRPVTCQIQSSHIANRKIKQRDWAKTKVTRTRLFGNNFLSKQTVYFYRKARISFPKSSDKNTVLCPLKNNNETLINSHRN